MRKLSLVEIEGFASRSKVKRIAVENFLMSMGEDVGVAFGNLEFDTKLYHWNRKTVNAIGDGIVLASRK